MSKVWVITGACDLNGLDILGVFSSKEKAEQAILSKEHNEWWNYYLDIEECEVDEQ